MFQIVTRGAPEESGEPTRAMRASVGRHRANSGRAESNLRGQRGGGRLKLIIWLLILCVFGYVCVKIVPVLFAAYQFQDTVQSTARLAAVTRQPDEELKKTIMQAAADNNLPVTPEEVVIAHKGFSVEISVDYSVTVDLSVYQWTFHFHPDSTGNAL
jgi:hypothetical protein